jgi:hypothetical protein
MKQDNKEKTDWLGINFFKELSLGRKIVVVPLAIIGLFLLLGNILTFVLDSILSL